MKGDQRRRRLPPRLLLFVLLASSAGWPRSAASAPAAARVQAAAAPTLSISPTSGGYPQTITLSGAGFGASEAVNVYVDSTGTPPLAHATASATGAFVGTVGVPDVIGGAHPLIAVGQSSGLSATAGLLVTPKTYLTASTVTPGTPDVLTGHGFAARETVKAYWQTAGGSPLGTATTYSKGAFTGAQSLTFTVPLSPAGTYNVVTVGLSSGGSYTRTLTLTTAGTPTPTPTATASGGAGTETPTPTTQPTLAGDWSAYLHDPGHTDADLDETVLSPATVPLLTTRWSFKTGDAAAGAPAVVNGTVYIGSWDGFEYALDAQSGALKWKTFLGLTVNTAPGCARASGQGITSAATVQGGVVYVGGGADDWYALDAATGAVLWTVYTGDTSPSGGYYDWSSPLLYNGYAYIGIASLCDNPLVPGQLLQVSLSTHQIVHTFHVLPTGQTGGSIWSTPAVDSATNTLYVTTGNDGTAPPAYPLSESMIALDATTLAIKGSWQLPPAQVVDDADFGGSSPVLFSDAAQRPLVAAINKNGYLYAFDRTNVSAGPVWERQLAVGGASPDSGDGSVSTGAFAAGRLYMAAYNTTISGQPTQGSVRAFDPTTGAILWEHSVPGVIFSALAYANGLIVAGASGYLEVLDAATGALLSSVKTNNSPYYGTVYSLSVAQGQIYAGMRDGTVDALGLPQPAATPTATPPPDAACPPGWACQDIGTPTPPGSETVAGGVYTVTAGGRGLQGSSDQLRFLAQSANGDTQLSARVVSQSGPSTGGQAGLLLRQSMDPAAPFYAVTLSRGHGLVVQDRTSPGNSVNTLATPLGAATPPLYLRIQRVNDGFAAATSPDGVTYTLVAGSQTTLVLPGRLLAGLAVSAQSSTRTATAVFSGVALGAPATAPATPTPPPDAACPGGWRCADIGNFAPSGSEALSGTTWTVRGAGQDLGGFYQPSSDGAAVDELHFVWQPLTGDGSVSARVITQTNTTSAARAGVLMRGSSDPSAPYYGVYLTPGKGVQVLYRLAQGNFIRAAGSAGGTAPLYVQVQRAGNTFTAATSTNGQTWQPIAGTAVTIDMGSTALGGVGVTSYAPGVLGSAQFDSVALSGASTTPTPTLIPTATPTPGGPTATPTATPTPTGPVSGTHSGSVASVGGADSYVFTPGAGGPASIGACAVSTGNRYTVAVYDSQGTLLGSGTTSSYCNWVDTTLSAGQRYTVTTTSVAGTGVYRSAWNVNGAQVVWTLKGSINTVGGSQSVSFPILSAGPIALSTCGPAGANFDLSLTSAGGTTLASGTTPSTCEAISYTPGARGLFRLIETSVSGTGAWSGSITSR